MSQLCTDASCAGFDSGPSCMFRTLSQARSAMTPMTSQDHDPGQHDRAALRYSMRKALIEQVSLRTWLHLLVRLWRRMHDRLRKLL